MTMKKTLLKYTALFAATLLAFSVQAKIITDVDGNQVDIPDRVERVADLWHANNQIVLLLGGADKLVATTTSISANPWYKEVYPRIKEVPVLTNGETIQIEELLAQKPDAVLLSKKSMLKEVNQAGLKGVHVSFQDFDGLKKTVRITADVLGGDAPKVAKKYIKELNDNINFVHSRVKDVKDSQKPRVLHITSGSDLLKIDGGKSMIGDWIRMAGGRNVLPDEANMVNVTMEAIVQANPDVIIIGSSGNKAQAAIEKIKADPTWQSISAVKNNRIYANPTGTFPWDRYSAEEALQILWAAQLFHPERFGDLDIVLKTQDFYQRYYNYSLSKENAQQILKGLPPLK
ncbi:ABC transporter substrate-binding protein [Aggregatibacter actinomycetemcomitans]|uniref:ABC transporter substrate-binding protein n=1 Tax=Aggregatibacter actinomycetemcomitans TaxID=714 RepID=UPI0011DB53DD|nr:ABC transporter substrate-binding protein [Aggregatibacter actinomycetemcomitans]TYA36868.1 ABC transporter substrate-binding protein [Aggregatibacter actinomycetemcomitans]TYB19712.1 ABC transporter substrate-binding protein [Aggregatibacter actinomycetemcomitans]